MWNMEGSLPFVDKLKGVFNKENESSSRNYNDSNQESNPQKVITIQPDVNVAKARPAASDAWRNEYENLDIHYANNFLEAGGKIIYCESLEDFLAQLIALKAAHGWQHIFSWEHQLRSFFSKNKFQAENLSTDMEHSQAAISMCHTAIADFGGIVLNSQQSSQRRIHIFPPVHLIFVSTDQIRPNLKIAVDDFKYDHPGELPSLIDLKNAFENNKHLTDTLILNAVGTKDIIVFLCDQPLDNVLR